jgi:hypothetical protein
MVFNATFNNISAIMWQSVLLVKETGVTEENHGPVTRHCSRLFIVQWYEVRFDCSLC